MPALYDYPDRIVNYQLLVNGTMKKLGVESLFRLRFGHQPLVMSMNHCRFSGIRGKFHARFDAQIFGDAFDD
jgi:hypothetical protein